MLSESISSPRKPLFYCEKKGCRDTDDIILYPEANSLPERLNNAMLWTEKRCLRRAVTGYIEAPWTYPTIRMNMNDITMECIQSGHIPNEKEEAEPMTIAIHLWNMNRQIIA